MPKRGYRPSRLQSAAYHETLHAAFNGFSSCADTGTRGRMTHVFLTNARCGGTPGEGALDAARAIKFQ